MRHFAFSIIYAALLVSIIKLMEAIGLKPNENVAGVIILGFILYIVMSVIDHLLERKKLHENHNR